MSYMEFESIVDTLIYKINDSGITFQAVAPILRSGAIPATIIANKLRIPTMLPIHVRLESDSNEIKPLLPFVLPLENCLGEAPNILIVETNTITGKTAEKSFEIIKGNISNANIYYATVGRVYRKPEIKLEMFKDYFWGIITDELFEANDDDKLKMNIRPKITIYPWETAEFELEEING